MVYYLKGVMEDLPEVITSRSTIPAANNIFQVRPEDERAILDEEWATELHHMVSQMLFVTSRARKCINMDIAFLCTKVRIPYKDEWGKLVRVIRCIIGTLHLPLILRADSPSFIKWWVDASFAAYPD